MFLEHARLLFLLPGSFPPPEELIPSRNQTQWFSVSKETLALLSGDSFRSKGEEVKAKPLFFGGVRFLERGKEEERERNIDV